MKKLYVALLGAVTISLVAFVASKPVTAQDLPASRRISLTVTNYAKTVVAGNDTNSSTQVVASRPNQVRWFLRVTNRTNTNICWSATGAATTNDVQLAAGEAVTWESPPFFNGAVYARHSNGATNFTGRVDVEERWQTE
jgi:hypothetical protein